MVNMWMVRAGENAFLIQDFIKYNVVAIGWDIGDLSNIKLDEIRSLLDDKYPHKIGKSNEINSKQIDTFVNVVKKDDYVLSFDSSNDSFILGRITSDYYHKDIITKHDATNGNYHDVRDVCWFGEIPKAKLKKSTLSEINIPKTIFEIKNNERNDIFKVFNDNSNIWILSAGKSDTFDDAWELFKKENYVAIESFGYDTLDFSTFNSKDELGFLTSSNMYAPNTVWKFVNVLKKGDLVIIRKGINKLAGIGIIVGDFIPQTESKIKNNVGLNNIRHVNWVFTPDDLEIKDKFSTMPLVDLRDKPYKWNLLLCSLSRSDDELKKNILNFLYDKFYNEFFNIKKGINYSKHYDEKVKTIKSAWKEISDKSFKNEPISDELWEKLFDCNVKIENGEEKSFNEFLDSGNYSDEKIEKFRIELFKLINQILNTKDPNEQKSVLKNYSNLKSSEVLALLSHILYCANNSFYIVDDNTRYALNFLNLMFGQEDLIDNNFTDYIDKNIKFKKFLNKLNQVYSYPNMDIVEFKTFYMFCHWLCDKDLAYYVTYWHYADRKVNKLPVNILGDMCGTMKSEPIDYKKLEIFPELLESKLQDFAINENTINQLCASLNAGKHIIVDGTPGTGKTDLAIKFSTVASENNFIDGYILTTATSDWSTFDTIGGLMPDSGGSLNFHQGKFLEAIAENKWLIIDEINRADIDKAFGQLFTVLSGQNVELPYKINEKSIKIKIWDENYCKFDSEKATYFIGQNWRIIGTMNVDDKDSLFDLSYAFMRRFMFIEVDLPQKDEYIKLISKWANDLDDYYSRMLINLYDLVNFRKLGPAIFKDMVDYIEFRNKLGSGDNELILAEAISSYIIPQLEGLNKTRLSEIKEFFDSIGLLDYLKDELEELVPNF